MTILFSSAGRRVGLIRNFRNAAQQLGITAEIVAVDMDPTWSPACHAADHFFEVPRCTEGDFISTILHICRKKKVDLIIPTIDTELIGYARNKSLFQEIGTEIHIGDSKFVTVARNKEATMRILSANSIPIPESWSTTDLMGNKSGIHFPLLLKPRGGSCSKGIAIVNTMDELEGLIAQQNDLLIQEVCTGDEYTVNCFYDRAGAFVSCVPHFRKFVRDGEVCFAQTERIPAFTSIARQLSEIFQGMWGCICFQGFKKEDESVKIFEINARFGGGYPICDYAGGTYARWILQDLLDLKPDYHDNWREGVRMLRYDEAFFSEF